MTLPNWAGRIRVGKLRKEVFWAACAKATALVLTLAVNAVLARRLGPTGFGLWGLFFSTYTLLLLISSFGLNISAKTFVAQAGHKQNLRNVLRAVFNLRLAAALLSAFLLLLFAGVLGGLFNRPSLTQLLRVAVLLLAAQGLLESVKAIFEGLHRLRYGFTVALLEFGGKFLLVFFLVKLEGDVERAVWSFTIAAAGALLVGLGILYARFYRGGTELPRDRPYGPLVRYAAPAFLALTGLAAASQLGTLILGKMGTNAEVARYFAAMDIASKLPHLAMVLAMGTAPIFADLSEERKGYLRGVFRKLMGLAFAAYGLVILIILLFARIFMPLLYGTELADSAKPLMLLTPYILAFGPSVILSVILDYRGKTAKRAVYILACVVLNAVLCVCLIPRYGAEGAAMATSIAHLPYFLLTLRETRATLRDAPEMAKN